MCDKEVGKMAKSIAKRNSARRLDCAGKTAMRTIPSALVRWSIAAAVARCQRNHRQQREGRHQPLEKPAGAKN